MPKKAKKTQPKRTKKSLSITLLVLFLSLGFILFQVQKPQESRSRAAITNCTVSASDLALDTEEQNFVKIVNEYRKTKGAGALKVSPNLNRAAAWMSRDMAAKENMDHTDSLGRDPGERMEACGYSDRGGENIAYGYANAAGTLKQWQSDEPHDAALKGSSYKVLGIARTKSASGDWYWTYDVGSDDDSGSTNPPAPTDKPVPSPACLGACPTTVPADDETPPTEAPEESEEPEGPQEPEEPQEPEASEEPEESEEPEPSPTNEPSNDNPPTTQNGLLGMLLQFFMLLLQLLFGGRP